jgi:hypothetical protein
MFGIHRWNKEFDYNSITNLFIRWLLSYYNSTTDLDGRSGITVINCFQCTHTDIHTAQPTNTVPAGRNKLINCSRGYKFKTEWDPLTRVPSAAKRDLTLAGPPCSDGRPSNARQPEDLFPFKTHMMCSSRSIAFVLPPLPWFLRLGRRPQALAASLCLFLPLMEREREIQMCLMV